MAPSLRHRVQQAAESIARAFAITQFRPAGSPPDLAEWFMGNPFGLNDEQIQHGEAFRRIPIIYALVSLIQNDCAALPRKFFDGEREIDEDRFGTPANVFKTANARQTGLEFRLNLFGDLELYARAHVYLERGRGASRNRAPFALWTLHPPMLKTVPGEARTVEKYIWYGAGEPQEIEPWKVLTIQKYGPDTADLNPVTWVEPAREDWMAQWYALKLLRQFYRRGGLSPGTWSMEGTGRPPDDADIKKWQRAYVSRFTNEESLWTPRFMHAMKQMEKGQSIGEMQIVEMVTLMNANACRAAGVPPWMMGIKEAGSLDQGKSSETSSENYWRSTIGNRVALVDAVFNERFCPLFGEGITMETDFEGVPALQQARLELLKGAVIAAEDAVVSVNEARSWVGYEDTGREEDDVPRMRPAPGDLFGTGPTPGDETNPEDQVEPTAEEPAAASAASTTARRHGPLGHPVTAASRRQRAERLRRRQERRLVREERAMERLWHGIRDEQLRYAIKALHEQEEKGFSALDRIDVDPERLYPGITEEQRKALLQRLRDTMEHASEAAADEIGRAVAIEIHSLAVEAYVQGRANRMIQNVTTTDQIRLRKAIGDAIGEGKQWNEVEQVVREFFDGRRANSMTIARTETAGPYNRAQHETWKAGGVERKFWLTMEDDAVREDHRIAGDRYSEDQSIGMDEPFIVGGASCMVPGETGDPSQDANCRCMSMPDLGAFEEGIEAAWPVRGWVNRVFRKIGKESTNGHAPANGVLAKMLGRDG